MTLPSSFKLDGRVEQLHKLGYSYRMIISVLKKEQISISYGLVHKIVHKIGKIRALGDNNCTKVRHKDNIRTPTKLKKVSDYVQKENSPTQRSIAKELKVSISTVNNIIHKDLNLVTKKKYKTHELTPLHEVQRWNRGKRLLRGPLLARNMEYVVTLDESWLYLSDVDSVSPICYLPKHVPVPAHYKITQKSRYGKKVMVVGIMTGRGNLPLVVVPRQTKFNSNFYMDEVMIPMITEWLPALYPGEMDKIFIHHDGATSHTSAQTKCELDELKGYFGFNYIAKEDIPPKSPDASPLDFFGFGYVKQRIRTCSASTLPALVEAANRVWLEIPVSKIVEVFSDWRNRLKLMVKYEGSPVEPHKAIHQRKIK